MLAVLFLTNVEVRLKVPEFIALTLSFHFPWEQGGKAMESSTKEVFVIYLKYKQV